MPTNPRSTYLISRSFRSFLLATILTGIIGQVCSLTDAMLVSHLVDSRGLSAMNITQPVSSTMYAIIMMFTSGASVLASREIGRRNISRALNIFYVAIYSGVSVVFALSMLIFMFCPQLIALLCDDPHLAMLAQDYQRTYVLVYPIQAISAVLFRYVKTDGSPQIVIRVAILSGILNVLFDCLFMMYLDMGISGSALGTVASFLISDLIFLPYLRHSKAFGHYFPRGHEMWGILGHNITLGLPNAVTDLMSGVMVLLVNGVVMRTAGDTGIFLWSIIYRLCLLSTILLYGLIEVNNSVGSVMMGEGDYTGVRILSRKSFRYMLACVGCLMLLIWLGAPWIFRAFGSSDEARNAACTWPLRIGSISIALLMIIYFFSGLFIQQQRVLASAVFSAMTYVSLTAGALLAGHLMPEHLWWGLSLFLVPLLIILVLYIQIEHYRHPSLDRFALQPLLPDEVSTCHTVSYTEESVRRAKQEISIFLQVCELSKALQTRIEVCCEEMLDNMLTYSHRDQDESQVFEVRLTEQADSIVVRLKDAGRPFDPTILQKEIRQDLPTGNGDIDHIGLRLVTALSSSFLYKYMFGLNVTTLTFAKS